MAKRRGVAQIWKSQATVEGAGVHLKRVFGYPQVPYFDPFLLLDDFHSENPKDYLAGFPWHPHRGIETVTYMLRGKVEHGDSMGNHGVIQGGDVQWMTAGSGIVHQEMPKQEQNTLLWGFQLWVNLPASHKMMAPRYQEITSAQIPELVLANGVKIKIVCGTVGDVKGPAQEIIVDPEYLDVTVPAGAVFEHQVKDGYTVFAYLAEGQGTFDEQHQHADAETLVLFQQDGDHLTIKADAEDLRFLLISGKPIGEPVAWHGPIVMNTKQELEVAFREYREGTFIK